VKQVEATCEQLQFNCREIFGITTFQSRPLKPPFQTLACHRGLAEFQEIKFTHVTTETFFRGGWRELFVTTVFTTVGFGA
jgi:hypothetical protein